MGKVLASVPKACHTPCLPLLSHLPPSHHHSQLLASILRLTLPTPTHHSYALQVQQHQHRTTPAAQAKEPARHHYAPVRRYFFHPNHTPSPPSPSFPTSPPPTALHTTTTTTPKQWASNARAPSPGQGASTTSRNARPAWGRKRSSLPISPRSTSRPSNFTCPTNASSPPPPPRPPSLPRPPLLLPLLRRARLCLNCFINATITTSAHEQWRCKD